MRDFRRRATSGVLLLLAGAAILMGIITAEALYPAPYHTDANTISDLGGTEPPEGLVLQPSAAIFDATMPSAAAQPDEHDRDRLHDATLRER
jgi:hypothetical protein